MDIRASNDDLEELEKYENEQWRKRILKENIFEQKNKNIINIL